MEAIIDLSGLGDVLSLLFAIVSALIVVLGLYIYFKKEHEMKFLLIGLGFLFFALSGLGGFTTIFDDNILTPWGTIMNFIGAILILLAIEPWKAFSD